MTLMDSQKPDFFDIKQILRLVVLAVILVACWRVWAYAKHTATPPINSFDSCVAAGNPVQESYPEQCAANGQTFTNPNQR